MVSGSTLADATRLVLDYGDLFDPFVTFELQRDDSRFARDGATATGFAPTRPLRHGARGCSAAHVTEILTMAAG